MSTAPRRQPSPSGVDRKKPSKEADGDPLGKLLEKHEVTLAGVLVASGVVGLAGGTLLVYGATGRQYALAALVVGSFIVLMALVLFGMNIFNIGRRLELRKRGVRWTQAGSTTELHWDEIADVGIKRIDDTYVGIANVRTRSSDAVRPSGPLTKTEFDVTIHGQNGRRIHLSRMFLRSVSDPKRLISNLRLRAGVE